MNKEMSKPIDRPRRYPIESPLQYRIRGERVWHSGFSRDMSETGILFKGEAELSNGAHFEARLVLPMGAGLHEQLSITFQAVVVRRHEEGMWAARIFARRLCRLSKSEYPNTRPGPGAIPPGVERPNVRGVTRAA